MYEYLTGRDNLDVDAVRAAFDRDALARVCAMHEDDFAHHYGLDTYEVAQPAPDNVFHYRVSDDSDSVLAVAHLDTVGHHEARRARFVDTEAGEVVFSRALDDRLGAYIILELLPALGIVHDVLLTVGEESGQSTAAFFVAPDDTYNWMIEFDRGGTDVVLYQYEDDALIAAVEDSGARVGEGIFSDISLMDHNGIKAINWGVGYRDYHGPRAHAYLEDTFSMVAKYVAFHEANAEVHMPHTFEPAWWNRSTTPWDDDGWDDDKEDMTSDRLWA